MPRRRSEKREEEGAYEVRVSRGHQVRTHVVLAHETAQVRNAFGARCHDGGSLVLLSDRVSCT